MEWDTNPRAKTDTHTHTEGQWDFHCFPFCNHPGLPILPHYVQSVAVNVSISNQNSACWGTRSALVCFAFLLELAALPPARPPACTIPCQSNFAGNLEGGTVSHWEALNRDVACLLFGLLSSCWGWVLPLLLLYASLHTFRCMSCTLEAVLLRRPYFSICSSWLSFESFLLAV